MYSLQNKYFSNINTIYNIIHISCCYPFLLITFCIIKAFYIYILPENLLLNTDRKLFSQGIKVNTRFSSELSMLPFYFFFVLVVVSNKMCVK